MAKKKEAEKKERSKKDAPKRDVKGHFIKEKKPKEKPAKAKAGRPKREKKEKRAKPKKDPSRVKLSPTSATFTGPGGMKVQAKVENNGYVPQSWVTANQPVEGMKQAAIERSRILTVKEVQAPTGTPQNKMQQSLKTEQEQKQNIRQNNYTAKQMRDEANHQERQGNIHDANELRKQANELEDSIKPPASFKAKESKHRQTREEALLVDARKDLGILEAKEKDATAKLLEARSEKGRKAALNEVARLQNEQGDAKKAIRDLENSTKRSPSFYEPSTRSPGESVQAHRADKAIHRAYAEGNPEMAHKIEHAKAEVIDTRTSPTRVSKDEMIKSERNLVAVLHEANAAARKHEAEAIEKKQQPFEKRQRANDLRWVESETSQVRAELTNRERQKAKHGEGAVGPTDIAYLKGKLNLLETFKDKLVENVKTPRPSGQRLHEAGLNAAEKVPYEEIRRFNDAQNAAEKERASKITVTEGGQEKQGKYHRM